MRTLMVSFFHRIRMDKLNDVSVQKCTKKIKGVIFLKYFFMYMLLVYTENDNLY